MQRKQRVIISILAITGMLAILFSSWMELSETFVSELHPAKAHHLDCSGPVSARSYLARVMVRFSGPGTASVTIPHWLSNNAFYRIQQPLNAVGPVAVSISRPIWLINRSLLI